MESMERKKILVVEVDRPTFMKFANPLKRFSFEVDRFPRASSAVELLEKVPFDWIICKYPTYHLKFAEFLTRLKGKDSASRNAKFVVIAESKYRSVAVDLLENEVDLVLSAEDPQEEVERLICHILGVPPRIAVRVMVKLRVRLESGTTQVIAQTENISKTGMKVATTRILPIGSKVNFTFTLPGSIEPIRGIAEVVRHTSPSRGETEGMGMRFINFEGQGEETLAKFLEYREKLLGR